MYFLLLLLLLIFCVISPRRKVCTVCVLPVGGSLPAHLPAREGPPPADCAGQTLCARKQQERQRRGRQRYDMCCHHKNGTLPTTKSNPLVCTFKIVSSGSTAKHLVLLLIEYGQTSTSSYVVARDFIPVFFKSLAVPTNLFPTSMVLCINNVSSQLRLSIRSFSCEMA